MFAVTYFSLVEADNAADAITIVQRAKAGVDIEDDEEDDNGEFVAETHQVGYIFARFCQTWKVALRQRLVRECGARLASYVKAQGIDAKVAPDESRLAIFVQAASQSQLALLPRNFNAVFQRS